MKKKEELKGKRIVLTQNADGAEIFKKELESRGGEVILLPLIESVLSYKKEETEDVLGEIATYEWVVFTSTHGVKFFFELFFKKHADIRYIGPVKFACIGEQTAKAVEELHLAVDLVPKEFTSAKLAAELIENGGIENQRILLVSGNLNDPSLKKELEGGRGIVDILQVYETKRLNVSKLDELSCYCKEGADVIIFASASAVESFCEQEKVLKLKKGAKQPLVCSIGAVTSQALKKHKVKIDVEAEKHSREGLLLALTKHFLGKI